MILFLMPLILIVTVTLIQESTFKDFKDTKIPIILVDNDKNEVSKGITDYIRQGQSFEIVRQSYDEITARNVVFGGEYQLAVIIPENLSKNLEDNIRETVEEIVGQMGYLDENKSEKTRLRNDKKPQSIRLYFDPATHLSFKNGVKNTIEKMIFKIENQKIYSAFEEQMGADGGALEQTKLIDFEEIILRDKVSVKPNSVQHNVPAWVVFAIFMIVIPLSINIVKDKNQGDGYAIVHLSDTVFYPCFGKNDHVSYDLYDPIFFDDSCRGAYFSTDRARGV